LTDTISQDTLFFRPDSVGLIPDSIFPGLDTLVFEQDTIEIDSVALARWRNSLEPQIITYFQKDKVFGTLKNKELKKTDTYNTDWLTIGFLGIFVYLVIVRILYSFDIWDIFRGILKIDILDQVGFEKQTESLAYALSPISAGVYGFYLYYFMSPQLAYLKTDFLFFFFAIGLSLLFLLKSYFEKIIALIFQTTDTFKAYYIDHLLILGIASLLQLPFIIVFFYTELLGFFWIGLSILGLFWVLRIFRGFIIGLKKTTYSSLYIILYLCSLEILPIALVIKYILNNQ